MSLFFDYESLRCTAAPAILPTFRIRDASHLYFLIVGRAVKFHLCLHASMTQSWTFGTVIKKTGSISSRITPQNSLSVQTSAKAQHITIGAAPPQNPPGKRSTDNNTCRYEKLFWYYKSWLLPSSAVCLFQYMYDNNIECVPCQQKIPTYLIGYC